VCVCVWGGGGVWGVLLHSQPYGGCPTPMCGTEEVLSAHMVVLHGYHVPSKRAGASEAGSWTSSPQRLTRPLIRALQPIACPWPLSALMCLISVGYRGMKYTTVLPAQSGTLYST
jgi:hypothetical protein